MKYIKLLVILLFLPTNFLYANELTTDIEKISYSLGLKLGEHYLQQGIELKADQFRQGLLAGLNKNPSALSEQEINSFLTKLQAKQIAKNTELQMIQSGANLTKGKEFLKNNKKNKNIKTLPSGLQYKILSSSKSKENSPNPKDIVTVNYRGTLIDGTEFDSSYKHNKSISFPLNHLIKGWQEALQLMKPGDKWQLFIPPELAYGEQAAGSMIQPNSTLIFDIELLSIKPSNT